MSLAIHLTKPQLTYVLSTKTFEVIGKGAYDGVTTVAQIYNDFTISQVVDFMFDNNLSYEDFRIGTPGDLLIGNGPDLEAVPGKEGAVSPRIVVTKIVTKSSAIDWTKAECGHDTYASSYVCALNNGDDPISFAAKYGWKIKAFRPPVEGEQFIADNGIEVMTCVLQHTSRLIVVKNNVPTPASKAYTPSPAVSTPSPIAQPRSILGYELCTKEESITAAGVFGNSSGHLLLMNSLGRVVAYNSNIPYLQSWHPVRPLFSSSDFYYAVNELKQNSSPAEPDIPADPYIQQRLSL